MNLILSLKKLFALFGPRQLQTAVLIPGSMFLVTSILLSGSLLLGSVLLCNVSISPFSGLLGALILGLMVPCLILGSAVGLILYLGHQWRTIAALQTPGAQDTTLPWNHPECMKSFVTGLHLAGYSLIILFGIILIHHTMSHLTGYQAQAALLEAPVIGDFDSVTYNTSDTQYINLFMRMFQSVLAELLLFTFLLPFILSPIFYNTRQPHMFTLLRSMVPSWRWMLKRYPHILGLTTCGFSMLLLGLGTCCMILSFTVVGIAAIPFVLAAGIYLMNVLLTRAYPSPYVMAPETLSVGEGNIKNI